MLHMRLVDTVEFFANSTYLADGTLITLVIQANESPVSDTYRFRLNSYKKPITATGSGYEFDAYLDVPRYWSGSPTDAVTSTSSGVLQSIAAECDLNFRGQSTNDSQLWLPRNLPYFEWARQISERGYRSDTSCMQMALTLNKELRFLDMTDFPDLRGNFIFPTPKQGFFLVTDFQPKSASGSSNHQSGYGEVRVQQSSILATTLHKDHNNVGVKKSAVDGHILMNSDVKNSFKQSKVRYSPIDIGNVHDHYEQAIYQNRRLSGMFSSKIELVTPERTGLGALDYVGLTLDFDTPAAPKIFNGNYWVSAHAIYIQTNNYYEKFELVSNVLKNNSSNSTE
jgi:hypothetical protein